jgi:hypothetical protein
MSAVRFALAAINSRAASMCSPLIKIDPRAVSAADFSFARGNLYGTRGIGAGSGAGLESEFR